MSAVRKDLVMSPTVDTIAPRMDLKTMPLDAAAEVLDFLAERETFSALEAAGEEIQSVEVRAMLRELAVELRKLWAATRSNNGRSEVEEFLTNRAKKLLTCLSPREEKSLLSAFGVIDK